MLLHQYDTEGPIAPSPAHFAAIDEVVASRFSFPVERGLARTIRRLAGVGRVPWSVAKAVPAGEARIAADAAVREFGPDLIWLDGPWLGEAGRRYAAEYGAPIAYRSHNVEHVYLRRQAKATSRRRNRIAWTLATVGLKRYELALMKASSRVLDISLDDLVFWQRHGVTDARWLPPLPELAVTGPPDEVIPGDIVFVGGLSLPNNVGGIRWLIDEVLPIVRSERPELTLSVVGSSARPEFAAELAANPAVRTFYDVPTVYPHLFGAKILVNPVAIGSGVQLKMLDMLMTPAPIVTRRQGVRGLPPECVAQVEVADTAERFAAEIIRHADAGSVDEQERERSRRFFTIAAVGEAIAEITRPAVADGGGRPRAGAGKR
ncbi:hypothetical protein GCM10027408_14430 [Microbacterium tumbae]